jgi:serine/threonine-protein kinase
VSTKFTVGLGEISPDGRWLAYQSNESGQNQIYVLPFPDVNSRPREQLSSTGGTMPLWAHSMNELFYLDGTRNLTTVPIQTKPAFKAGTPTRLLERRYFSAGQGRSYDVSSDGQRFLMIKEMQASDEAVNRTSSIIVVQNWTEELKRLVPTK